MTNLLVVKNLHDKKLLSRVVHREDCLPILKDKIQTEAVNLFELDSTQIKVTLIPDWKIGDLVA